MKHLKKLTRKGLEELAKEMPQVNEKQQSGMVAGASYYCHDEVNNTFSYYDTLGYGLQIYIGNFNELCDILDRANDYYLYDVYAYTNTRTIFTNDTLLLDGMGAHDFGGTPINIASDGAQYSFFSQMLSTIPNVSGLVINRNWYGDTSWNVSGGIVNLDIYSPPLSILDTGSGLIGSSIFMDELELSTMLEDVDYAIQAEMNSVNH